MNFRTTTLFFALLLTMLWAFGYMIAHKKTATDPGFIMIKMNKPDAKDINHVNITRTEKGEDAVESDFSMIGERWFLNQKDQKVKVLGIRIDDIVRNIKAAKPDETADVSKDAKHFGLDKPRVVVKITGKYKGEEETWELKVGNESGGVVYVQSSDRGDKIFAVNKKSIDNIFFKDANTLRDKRLFDYADAGVVSIIAKKGQKELELQKKGDRWYFEHPKYGFAGFESEQADDPKDPHKKQPFMQPQIGGVKGLLKSIKEVRVEDETTDFVPLGKGPGTYGFDKPTMRIEVTTKTEGKDAKKSSEILVVGSEAGQVGRIKYWYAKLEGENGDDGVMKISDTWLNPVRRVIDDPEKIRSLDVGDFDTAKVDVLTIKHDGAETQFFKLEEKDKSEPRFPPAKEKDDFHWNMVIAGAKKKASDDAVKMLLDIVHGKRGIVAFPKGTLDEQKAKEAEWNLKTPPVEIAVYIGGIEKAEEKKPENKDPKKDPKKEVKKDEVKKEEPKKDAVPALKKKYDPEITLAIGKIEGDNVHVRRTLKDGTVTYFTMKKTIAEMSQPPEGIELAFRERLTPSFTPADAITIKLERSTDKGRETVELESRDVEGRQLWHIKEKSGKDAYTYSLADSDKVNGILQGLSPLRVNKWVKKYDEKADADKLKDAPLKIEVTFKRLPNYASAIVGQVALAPTLSSVPYGAIATAPWTYPAGETVTVEFGKETDVEKDKPGTFGRHSGAKDLLFLVTPQLVKNVKELDLHDRTFMLLTQPELNAFYLGTTATNPFGPVNLAGNPYVQGNVHNFDPEQVKEVRLMIRTPAEVRKFVFEGKEKEKPKEDKKPMDDKKPKEEKKPAGEKKDEKEKDKPTKWTWTDKSPNLEDFHVDPDKVTTLIKDFAKLRTDRFVTIIGGPRPEHKLIDKDGKVDKEAKAKLEFVMVDGKTITVVIGADFVPHGHFATTSVWLGNDGKNSTVFFVPRHMVDILMRGTAHFAKERTTGN